MYSLLDMIRKYTLIRVCLGCQKNSCTALHKTISTNTFQHLPGSYPVFRNNKKQWISILRCTNDYLNQRSQRSLNSACFNSRRSSFKLFISLNISVVISWRFVSVILHNNITRSLIINGTPAFVSNPRRCPPLWRHGRNSPRSRRILRKTPNLFNNYTSSEDTSATINWRIFTSNGILFVLCVCHLWTWKRTDLRWNCRIPA